MFFPLCRLVDNNDALPRPAVFSLTARRPPSPASRPIIQREASSSALLDSQSDLRSLASSPSSSTTSLRRCASPVVAQAIGGARQVADRHKRNRNQANARFTTTSQASHKVASSPTTQQQHHHNGDIFGTRRGDHRKDISANDNGSVPISGVEKKSEKLEGEPPSPGGPHGGLLLRAYYLCTSLGSVVAVVFMVIAFATPYWEHIRYERDKVVAAADGDPDVTVAFPTSGAGAGDNGYFTVTNVAAILAAATTTAKTATAGADSSGGGSGVVVNGTLIPAVLHIPMKKLGGLWSTCDTIPDDLRQQLLREATGVLYPKCMSHLKYTEVELRDNVQLDMLLSLSRSGNACAIVAIITACTALGLGTFSVLKQQIVFAVITGVCFGAAGLYTLFTVTLMLLRKVEVAQDEHAMPAVALAGRVVSSGWAMYLGWMSFLLCTACCVFWILLSVEQRRSRQNYVFSSNYDQICSM